MQRERERIYSNKLEPVEIKHDKNERHGILTWWSKNTTGTRENMRSPILLFIENINWRRRLPVPI